MIEQLIRFNKNAEALIKRESGRPMCLAASRFLMSLTSFTFGYAPLPDNHEQINGFFQANHENYGLMKRLYAEAGTMQIIVTVNRDGHLKFLLRWYQAHEPELLAEIEVVFSDHGPVSTSITST